MHNLVQFGAISATVGLIIVAALMALAIFADLEERRVNLAESALEGEQFTQYGGI